MKEFSKLLEGSQNLFVELPIGDYLFYIPKHTWLKVHNMGGSTCFRRIQERGNSTRHLFLKLNNYPTYKRNRKNGNPCGVLFKSSKTCESSIRSRNRIQLIQLSQSQFSTTIRLVSNTRSTSTINNSPQNPHTDENSQKNWYPITNFSSRRKRYNIPTPRNHIIQGFTSKSTLNLWYDLW